MIAYLKWCKNLFFVILTVIIFLALSEIFCRLYESIRQDFGKDEVEEADYLLEVPFRHFIYKPNIDNSTDCNTHFTTNRFGYRGKDFSIEKPLGIFRIIALGDSTTFGFGAADNSTTYPVLLEKKLQEKFPEKKFEVINAGLPGYSTTHLLIFYGTELAKFNPDLVIIYAGWNDLQTSVMRGWNKDRRFGFFYGQDSSEPEGRKAIKFKDMLTKYSAFMRRYDKIIYKINKHKRKKQKNKDKVDDLRKLKSFQDFETRKSTIIYQGQALEIFNSSLTNLVKFIKTGNTRILLLTLPALVSGNMTYEEKLKCSPYMGDWYIYSNKKDFYKLYEEYNHIIKDIASGQSIGLLDAEEMFSSLENKSDYFLDHNHLTDKGNAYLVDIIMKKLEKGNLLEK